MSAAASLHAPTCDAAQLTEQPANNDGDSRTDTGLRVHERDDAKQIAQSFWLVSPAMRLYRHALESIFAMLQLEDLSRALAVCRSWTAAVRSMTSIDATILRSPDLLGRMYPYSRPLPPITSLVASPLIRHLAAVHIMDSDSVATPLTSESLALLLQHAPHLTSLWCSLALTPDTPLFLPVSLTSLKLTLGLEYAAAEINAVLTALAALPSLSRLILQVQTADDVDLSLLAASRTLTDFTLRRLSGGLSDAQVAQIRSSFGHLQRIDVGTRRVVLQLLQPPVIARWQDIGEVRLDARTEALLLTLPSLTTLHLQFVENRPHADFLLQLPHLKNLRLWCYGGGGSFHVPPAAMLHSLLPCTGLTQLFLDCGFNSAHWTVLLAQLTSLTQLTIDGDLESLDCFSAGPITRTLEKLSLKRLSLPPSEIAHLYALHCLRDLRLKFCFDPPLNEAILHSFSPPTALFPRLTEFAYCSSDSSYSPLVARWGRSFEWMQSAAPPAAPCPVTSRITNRTEQPTRSDNADDEEKQTAQSSTHVSPAMRLYPHALESIFALLQLHDLTQTLAVSLSWSAAVRSMKPIGAMIERDEDQLRCQGMLFRPLPPIAYLVASPLLRHLAGIHVRGEINRCCFATQLTRGSLALLAQHAPNLASLWCTLTLLPSPAPLILPANLTSLELYLAQVCSAVEINRVLSTLAALHSLQRLLLRCDMTVGVDLSLLAASRSLRDLTLVSLDRCCPEFSDSQVVQICSALGHLQRVSFGNCVHHDALARFLQPPITMRWQDVGFVMAEAGTGHLLVALPTLTSVALEYCSRTPHVRFLSKLPLLSTLNLICGRNIWSDPVLASLLPCTGLTELDLHCEFKSKHVRALLTALTKLNTLKLGAQLDTLQCLASGPNPRTLEELCLSLRGPALLPSELVHLYALKGLRSLELDSVFESLDDAAITSLTPPTAHLPRLTRFVNTIATGWHRVERTGPSFEWMQQ